MSKKDRLGKFDFMPDEAQTVINNSNLSDMFRGLQTDYSYLPVCEIDFNPENDYANDDSEEEIKKLAEDIARNGLLHNIVVSEVSQNHYKLLSGERRLRAYLYLFRSTKDEKYQTIYALIKRNLSSRQEFIIMDAANLQTRGALSDERKFRKAGIRFIENLKEEFSISDKEAIHLAKEYASTQERTIDRNLLLERDLNKSLLSLLDRNILSKREALIFASLRSDLQSVLADILLLVVNKPQEIRASTIQKLLSLSKEWKKAMDELQKNEDLLEQILFEEKYADTEEKKILEMQKKKISDIIQKEKESVANIENILEKAKDSGEYSENAGISERIFKEIKKSIDCLEKECNHLQKQFCEEKKKYLSSSSKNELIEDIEKIEAKIKDLLSQISS